jgi:hypothetical protein
MESNKFDFEKKNIERLYNEALELQTQASREKREAENLFQKKREIEDSLNQVKYEVKQ